MRVLGLKHDCAHSQIWFLTSAPQGAGPLHPKGDQTPLTSRFLLFHHGKKMEMNTLSQDHTLKSTRGGEQTEPQWDKQEVEAPV